jgi:hypothetical protein
MVRLFLAGLLGLAMTLSAVAVDDTKTGDKKDPGKAAGKGREATITAVNPKAGTLKVKMTDASGKETERTFTLTEEVRYADSTGRVVAADVFKSGDYVLVVEADGKLKEVRQSKKGGTDKGKKK